MNMATRRKVFWLLAAMLVLGAAAGGVAAAVGSSDDSPSETREEQAFTQAHEGEVAVTRADAEAAAIASHPGTIVGTELERQGAGLVWNVEVDDGGRVIEVVVDARDGSVVAGESESGDDGDAG
jgi:uncharacterized membrane protein YkoI